MRLVEETKIFLTFFFDANFHNILKKEDFLHKVLSNRNWHDTCLDKRQLKIGEEHML